MKLPRPQFHLATGVLLMLTASVLLALNIIPRIDVCSVSTSTVGGLHPYSVFTSFNSYSYGWPLITLTDYSDLLKNSDLLLNRYTWLTAALALDIITALAILTIVAAISEFLLRRRNSNNIKSE